VLKVSIDDGLFIEHCISAFNYSACDTHPELPGLSGVRISNEYTPLGFRGEFVRTVSVLDVDVCLTPKQAEVTEVRQTVEPGHIR
jgi:hypothetical protein